MAMHVGLRRLLQNLQSSSSSTTTAPLLRPLASSNFHISNEFCGRFAFSSSNSDGTIPPAPPSDGEPSLSHANVATLDDVSVSASVIESTEAVFAKARVAPLPEDLSQEDLEAANYVAPPVEKIKLTIPYPTLAKVERRGRQEPQVILDAIRMVKVS